MKTFRWKGNIKTSGAVGYFSFDKLKRLAKDGEVVIVRGDDCEKKGIYRQSAGFLRIEFIEEDEKDNLSQMV
jgi:hypothetical protein